MTGALLDIQKIIENQATVKTSKLAPLFGLVAQEIIDLQENNISADDAETLVAKVAELEAEVDRKEAVIVRLQQEAAQQEQGRKKHKVAMKDYENLKKNHKRLREEYNMLVAARTKDKEKLKRVNRELTDVQVKYAALDKKFRKLVK